MLSAAHTARAGCPAAAPTRVARLLEPFVCAPRRVGDPKSRPNPSTRTPDTPSICLCAAPRGGPESRPKPSRGEAHDGAMSNFSNPFKKPPTAKEAAKAVKKDVRSSQRDLDRELRDMDRREKQLIKEIQEEAKRGRSEKAVKMLAKNLVQLRNQRERTLAARSHVGAIATHASAMAASATVAESIGTVAAWIFRGDESRRVLRGYSA